MLNAGLPGSTPVWLGGSWIMEFAIHEVFASVEHNGKHSIHCQVLYLFSQSYKLIDVFKWLTMLGFLLLLVLWVYFTHLHYVSLVFQDLTCQILRPVWGQFLRIHHNNIKHLVHEKKFGVISFAKKCWEVHKS